MKKSQKIILAIITVLWVCAIGVEALRYVDEGAFAFQSETTTVNGENEEETSNEKQTEETTQESEELLMSQPAAAENNRLAILGIIIENRDSAEKINAMLHEYARYIVGRMGMPYEKKACSFLCVHIM